MSGMSGMSGMSAWSLQRLTGAVQANCHRADARHAADMTLCIYLLQMREFFRWERGLPFAAPLPRQAVGSWIAEREALWSGLEDSEFEPLPLPSPRLSAFDEGCEMVDPFDLPRIAQALAPLGLIYGAGLVAAQRPVFFLAQQYSASRSDTSSGPLPVLTAGTELARGLVSPLATLGLQGAEQVIVIRREALARWCWERFETYSLRRTPGTPMHALVQAYGLDQGFDAALPRWLDEQSEVLLLHELAEHQVGQRLGSAWADLRLSLTSRRAELQARALRDLLADCSSTLPTLLERGADRSLHGWFAAFEGLRQLLYPGLSGAYACWRGGDGGLALRQACDIGVSHFGALAEQALALHAQGGDNAQQTIEKALLAPAACCGWTAEARAA